MLMTKITTWSEFVFRPKNIKVKKKNHVILKFPALCMGIYTHTQEP